MLKSIGRSCSGTRTFLTPISRWQGRRNQGWSVAISAPDLEALIANAIRANGEADQRTSNRDLSHKRLERVVVPSRPDRHPLRSGDLLDAANDQNDVSEDLNPLLRDPASAQGNCSCAVGRACPRRSHTIGAADGNRTLKSLDRDGHQNRKAWPSDTFGSWRRSSIHLGASSKRSTRAARLAI